MKRDTRLKIGLNKARNAKKLETDRQLAYNAPVMKRLRLEIGLTQEQVANEIGIGLRTVQRFEDGQAISKLAKQAIESWLKTVEWQSRVATKGISNK